DEAIKRISSSVLLMIEELPDIYREALILTEFEGMKQKQLAESLGLSLPGAKSRVQRAREQLKQLLLDCCNFELDHFGNIIDYNQRNKCCKK
ncbi:MAG: sigma factor-like helix-turn-helix DNA-binding protein, partial [Methanococcaceae archaeon]